MFAQSAQRSHIVRRGRAGQLGAPRAGIPLAHRCRKALRGIQTQRPSESFTGAENLVSQKRLVAGTGDKPSTRFPPEPS
eukprot:7520628-Pyramimonas_sp.AAC.1